MSIRTWRIWRTFGARGSKKEKFTPETVTSALSRFQLPQDEQDSIAGAVHNGEELKVIVQELEGRKTQELTRKIVELSLKCVEPEALRLGQAALTCAAHQHPDQKVLHKSFACLQEELAVFHDLRAQAFAEAAHKVLPEPLVSGYLWLDCTAEGQIRVSVMKRENHVWRATTIFELLDSTVEIDRDFWLSVCKSQAQFALNEHNGNNALNWLHAERLLSQQPISASRLGKC